MLFLKKFEGVGLVFLMRSELFAGLFFFAFAEVSSLSVSGLGCFLN